MAFQCSGVRVNSASNRLINVFNDLMTLLNLLVQKLHAFRQFQLGVGNKRGADSFPASCCTFHLISIFFAIPVMDIFFVYYSFPTIKNMCIHTIFSGSTINIASASSCSRRLDVKKWQKSRGVKQFYEAPYGS